MGKKNCKINGFLETVITKNDKDISERNKINEIK